MHAISGAPPNPLRRLATRPNRVHGRRMGAGDMGCTSITAGNGARPDLTAARSARRPPRSRPFALRSALDAWTVGGERGVLVHPRGA